MNNVVDDDREVPTVEYTPFGWVNYEEVSKNAKAHFQVPPKTLKSPGIDLKMLLPRENNVRRSWLQSTAPPVPVAAGGKAKQQRREVAKK